MRLGIDFGGTKIEAIVLDFKGEIRARARVANPGDYDAAIDAVAALKRQLEDEAGGAVRTVGVGIPGSLSPATGLVRNANSVWLNGKPFEQDLEAALGCSVRIENDANCFAVSEAADGAAVGAWMVFGVILGTGCGGGLAVGGRVVRGASGVAGEWGHTPLPWPCGEELQAPTCWCGRNGCMETWVSGPAFRRWAGMSAEEADLRAQAGDRSAGEALDLLADRLARGLAVVIDIVDPDVVVFGGGVSNVDALYPAVRWRLGAYVFSDVVSTRIEKNWHGDSSGVRGAAWLFTAEEAR